MNDREWTIGEAVELTEIPLGTINSWIHRGGLPPIGHTEGKGKSRRVRFSDIVYLMSLRELANGHGETFASRVKHSSTLRIVADAPDLLIIDRFFVACSNSNGIGVITEYHAVTADQLGKLIAPPSYEAPVTSAVVVNVSAIARYLVEKIENPPSDTSDEEADRIIAEAEAAMDARERRSPAIGGNDA
jgi:hypothetical protein